MVIGAVLGDCWCDGVVVSSDDLSTVVSGVTVGDRAMVQCAMMTCDLTRGVFDQAMIPIGAMAMGAPAW